MMLDSLPFRHLVDSLGVRSAVTRKPSPAALPAFALKAAAAAFAGLCLVAAVSGRAEAQEQSVPIVRDAEIEALVRDYARPILQAAGGWGNANRAFKGKLPVLLKAFNEAIAA